MQLMMDPQGAAFYIIEPASSEQRPERPGIGDASWHELMTTDMTAAMKLYQEVFGWQPDQTMDMGAMGKYQMFDAGRGTVRIGGIMNTPPEMANVPPVLGKSTSACPTWMRPPNASSPRAARFSTAPWTFLTGTGS